MVLTNLMTLDVITQQHHDKKRIESYINGKKCKDYRIFRTFKHIPFLRRQASSFQDKDIHSIKPSCVSLYNLLGVSFTTRQSS
jgi:hypothetical protein